MAHAVTEGETTEYDQAMALQQWFRQDGKFTYSTEAPADGGGDAVAEFLVARKGFCIQFSSAMAVMARALGIPARIGVGFLPGRPGPDQWRSVLLTDAHAWPELYFEGIGWVRFEPTPASRSGAAPSWAQPATSSATGDGNGSASGTAGSANAAEQGASAKTRQLEREEAPPRRSPDGSTPLEQPAGATGQDNVVVPRRLIAAGAGVAIVLLLLLLVPVTAAVSRVMRRRRARDRRALVDAAWDELAERVADLGVTIPAGATPRQLAALLAGYLPAPRPSTAAGLGAVGDVRDVASENEAHRSLRRARQTVERSRYSRAGADPSAAGVDASTMVDDVRTVVRAIAAGRTRGDRLTARLLPASGRRLLRDWAERQGRRVARVDVGAARGVRLLLPRRGRA
jgi:hypothetical protein